MDDANNLKVLRDRIDMLYKNSFPGIAISVLAASGLVFGFSDAQSLHLKIFWWASMMLVLSIRVFHTLRWKLSRMSVHNTKRYLLYCRSGVIFTAILWAVYCVCFYDSNNVYHAFIIIVTVSALSGGAATILSSDRLSVLLYTQILLGPFSIRLLISDLPDHRILGALGLTFCIIMYLTGRRASEFTYASIILRHQHDHLLNNMQSEIDKRAKQIQQISEHDPLTQLFNRPAFIQNTQHYINKHSHLHFAVFFVDLDKFKPINDHFGHSVGDSILQMFARRLENLAMENFFSCRWGGDEFIIFAQTHYSEDLEVLARQIKQAATGTFQIEQHQLELDAAIGVARYPQDSHDLVELIEFADSAMYQNKAQPKQNFSLFDVKLRKHLNQELAFSEAIKHAVDNNQLSIELQPVLHTQTGQLTMVEALVRWDFNGQVYLPNDFIYLAEKNGAILKIGQWVVEESLRIQNYLSANACEIDVSVNISVLQTDRQDFAEHIISLVDHSGINPNKLTLEITEMALTKNRPRLIRTINKIKQAGVKILLDNFGSSQSSLATIQDLQIDLIKIDRSFVQNIDNQGSAIINAIMSMSRDLDFKVIAEGVENTSQKEQLLTLGVHYLQGYEIMLPVSVEEFLNQYQKLNSRQNVS